MKFNKDTQTIAEQSLAYFLSEGHYLNIIIDETPWHRMEHKSSIKELKELYDVSKKIFDSKFFNDTYIDYYKFLRRENGDTSRDKRALYKLALEFIQSEKIWEEVQSE